MHVRVACADVSARPDALWRAGDSAGGAIGAGPAVRVQPTRGGRARHAVQVLTRQRRRGVPGGHLFHGARGRRCVTCPARAAPTCPQTLWDGAHHVCICAFVFVFVCIARPVVGQARTMRGWRRCCGSWRSTTRRMRTTCLWCGSPRACSTWARAPSASRPTTPTGSCSLQSPSPACSPSSSASSTSSQVRTTAPPSAPLTALACAAADYGLGGRQRTWGGTTGFCFTWLLPSIRACS
jgi:hypothetical protein